MEWGNVSGQYFDRGGYTGRECHVRVKHIVSGELWLQPGVVAMSIELITAHKEDAGG